MCLLGDALDGKQSIEFVPEFERIISLEMLDVLENFFWKEKLYLLNGWNDYFLEIRVNMLKIVSFETGQTSISSILIVKRPSNQLQLLIWGRTGCVEQLVVIPSSGVSTTVMLRHVLENTVFMLAHWLQLSCYFSATTANLTAQNPPKPEQLMNGSLIAREQHSTCDQPWSVFTLLKREAVWG